MSTAAPGNSCIDAIAMAAVGFVLGICVNNAVPTLRWLLWIFAGH